MYLHFVKYDRTDGHRINVIYLESQSPFQVFHFCMVFFICMEMKICINFNFLCYITGFKGWYGLEEVSVRLGWRRLISVCVSESKYLRECKAVPAVS